MSQQYSWRYLFKTGNIKYKQNFGYDNITQRNCDVVNSVGRFREITALSMYFLCGCLRKEGTLMIKIYSR